MLGITFIKCFVDFSKNSFLIKLTSLFSKIQLFHFFKKLKNKLYELYILEIGLWNRVIVLVGDVMDNFLRISWLNEMILMLQIVLSSMYIEINEKFCLLVPLYFPDRVRN